MTTAVSLVIGAYPTMPARTVGECSFERCCRADREGHDVSHQNGVRGAGWRISRPRSRIGPPQSGQTSIVSPVSWR
jgi:hypothetical protein